MTLTSTGRPNLTETLTLTAIQHPLNPNSRNLNHPGLLGPSGGGQLIRGDHLSKDQLQLLGTAEVQKKNLIPMRIKERRRRIVNYMYMEERHMNQVLG